MNRKEMKIKFPAVALLAVLMAMMFLLSGCSMLGGIRGAGNGEATPEATAELTADPSADPSAEPTGAPTGDSTAAATNAPTEKPVATKKPSAGASDYERYQNMSKEQQVEFYNSFSDPMDFFAWFDKAQQEYESQRDVIELDGNTNIDLGEILD